MVIGDDILRSALESIPQDRDGLLRSLIARLDDSMVREIAEADYRTEASEHEAAIREICRTLAADLHLSWYPNEVLSSHAFGRKLLDEHGKKRSSRK